MPRLNEKQFHPRSWGRAILVAALICGIGSLLIPESYVDDLGLFLAPEKRSKLWLAISAIPKLQNDVEYIGLNNRSHAARYALSYLAGLAVLLPIGVFGAVSALRFRPNPEDIPPHAVWSYIVASILALSLATYLAFWDTSVIVHLALSTTRRARAFSESALRVFWPQVLLGALSMAAIRTVQLLGYKFLHKLR